jgi:hypothetical protein
LQTEFNNTFKTSYTQVGFIPGYICNSINIIQHINRIKNKNQMIFSIDSEKPFDKIQHIFMITAMRKLGIEVTYLNIIKAVLY